MEPQNHTCNKDVVLLNYPAQYKCSICGKVDDTNFIKAIKFDFTTGTK